MIDVEGGCLLFDSGERRFDFASCFSLTNLMKASKECCKGTDWKYQPQRFVHNRLTNCASLLKEIESGTYKPLPVEKFTVLERGKIRDVKPVNFRDRVAQRCVCDNVLIPLIHDVVIDDNSACIKGRGLSYAYDRVRVHAEKCPYDGWLLQFDFSKYFASISQPQLIESLRSIIEDDKIMNFLEVTIKDDEGGLELGSHVSQLCAMMYPDSMDRAILSTNGVNGYHRYMDDGVVFCDDKESALRVMDVLLRESDKLCLNLNVKKTHVEPVKQPFVFCKMRFSKFEDGTVRMNVRKAQSRKAVKHAVSVNRLATKEPDKEIDMTPVIASLSGYLNRGDANLDRLVKSVL